MSVATGLLVRIDAKPGKGRDVEHLLESSLDWVETEPHTTAWFAVRTGRDAYGIIDVFTDERGREDHLAGPVVKALAARADEILADPPRIRRFDVIAQKMPEGSTVVSKRASVTKGVLLRLPPKRGKASELAEFLEGARPLVEAARGLNASPRYSGGWWWGRERP